MPNQVGDFPLTVKVFDNARPPGFAERDLVLPVAISPLVIIGGIPLPYRTELRAPTTGRRSPSRTRSPRSCP